MYDGKLELYEDTTTQDQYGTRSSGSTLVFETAAKVYEGGEVRGSPQTGFDAIGEVTVYPQEWPSVDLDTGQKAVVTDRRGNTSEARIAESEPDGAMNGKMLLNYL